MDFLKNDKTVAFIVFVLITLIIVVLGAIFFVLFSSPKSSVPQDTTMGQADVTTPQTVQNTTPQTTPNTTQLTTPSPATTSTAVVTTPVQTTTAKEQDEPEKPEVARKKVAFTFDDGPNGNLTYKFADKLKEYGATATFFVVGNRIGQVNGAAIKYVVENGCEIAIHSYAHNYYNKMTMDEYLQDMQKTEDAIKKYVDADVRLMRPPGGILSAAQRDACPYSVIMWSVDSNDWQYTGRSEEKREQNIQTIVDNVMSVIKEGDIVLMHELYENSYEAFCIIIEQLYDQGYEIVSVSELLGDRLTPGKSYYNGR